MKRIASVILAAVLLLTGIQDVCAAEKEGPGGRAEIDVYARYAEGGSSEKRYPLFTVRRRQSFQMEVQLT